MTSSTVPLPEVEIDEDEPRFDLIVPATADSISVSLTSRPAGGRGTPTWLGAWPRSALSRSPRRGPSAGGGEDGFRVHLWPTWAEVFEDGTLLR
ncbi:hypothetical protein LX15_006258 [Streptoalloteichus tenebrarius]|uniref:Uncharacterized protein n=1 Tax=Streptoalloteichus tenebrarius (strain ATCC 17920 / DSM 40477 / JCM 4838 / CBS 697.72 / NBRC 16177 / NCIMB 11028 / NRRL B-12390 / A12253. 1 / ISP 5477) TaxID=1933 RepID=A0ABT1I403_STRSD|nr:hypothetical protein [Streptoalloteichus tenebrarius]MCP2262518.1 hypothetical protein [Streptoalloteichus tenebrarius]BFE99115.1 hypothetical protein GCM10020241_07910 [Streptoalloteichus tenebrarius]